MKSRTTDAVRILHDRYVGASASRRAQIEGVRLNMQVAALIVAMRERAGLTQSQLAGAIGTTQSVISRLEDADYRGHSLRMLARIAAALGQDVRITAKPVATPRPSRKVPRKPAAARRRAA